MAEMEERQGRTISESAEIVSKGKKEFTRDGFDFTLLFNIEASAEKGGTSEGRREIVKGVEAAMRESAGVFTNTVLLNFLSSMKGDFAEVINQTRLFTWMRSEEMAIKAEEDFGYSLWHKFDLERPLAGQSAVDLNIVIGRVLIHSSAIFPSAEINVTNPGTILSVSSRQAQNLELLVVRLKSVNFEQGSLWNWIEGHVQVLTLGAMFLLGGVSTYVNVKGQVTPPEVRAVERFRASMAHALQGQPMVIFRGLKVSDEYLEKYGERSLNYEEPGIGDDERRYRIALVQLALKLEYGTELSIDGQLGPVTIEALRKFAASHNAPPSIRNPFLRAALLKVLLGPPRFK